jgi:hypothetical protein
MYEHVVAETTATDGTPFRVILEPDTDRTDLDPRKDYSNAGVMYVQTQRRYNVPQEADLGWASPDLDDAIDRHDFRVVARWLRIFHGATAVLPLYSPYSGNEFNISAGDLDDAPEAGDYIGVTFDTAATRKDTGFVSPVRMAACLAADVATYRQWAEGDVWGYRVQRGTTTDEETDSTEWYDDEDSCWGFIDQQWAEEAAEEALDSVVATYVDQVAEAAQRAAEDEEEIADLRRTELGIPA